MKRNLALFFAVFVAALATLVGYPDGTSAAQQKKPTAKEKMAKVDYLVGSWSCEHTVGTFAGKYTTKYTKVLGDRWLKQALSWLICLL